MVILVVLIECSSLLNFGSGRLARWNPSVWLEFSSDSLMSIFWMFRNFYSIYFSFIFYSSLTMTFSRAEYFSGKSWYRFW
jgi:hypothetical protein